MPSELQDFIHHVAVEIVNLLSYKLQVVLLRSGYFLYDGLQASCNLKLLASFLKKNIMCKCYVDLEAFPNPIPTGNLTSRWREKHILFQNCKVHLRHLRQCVRNQKEQVSDHQDPIKTNKSLLTFIDTSSTREKLPAPQHSSRKSSIAGVFCRT